MARPVVLTLLGGPADLQRHTLDGPPPGVYLVPAMPKLNLNEMLGDRTLELDIARYRTYQLKDYEGRDVWVGVHDG